MKILIVGLNFHPELLGIGKYSGELAQFLAGEGHQIRVVTAPPYYPYWQIQKPYHAWRYKRETWQGVDILRCPLWVPRKPSGKKRLLHHISFALSSLPILLSQLKWKPEVVICIAPSILNSPFALVLARLSGASAWLHIQDFELEAAAQLGMLSAHSLIIQLASQIERWLLAQFDRVSTISNGMLKRLAQKGVSPLRCVSFPNWIDTDLIYPLEGHTNLLRTTLDIPEDKLVVLYSGNLGHKQGLGILLDAARLLIGYSEILFVICGDGAMKAQLQEKAISLSNIRFYPLQPIEHLNELLNLADIHVLPQRTDAAGLVMPSKLLGMLASARPVIATAHVGTELAQVVDKAGVVVPPEDANALAEGLLQLAGDPTLRSRLGAQGRRLCKSHWAKNRVLRSFTQEMSKLNAESG